MRLRAYALRLPHKVWICLSLDLLAFTLFLGWFLLPTVHPWNRGPPVRLPAANPGGGHWGEDAPLCVTVTRDGSTYVEYERLETPLLEKVMQDAVAAHAWKMRTRGRSAYVEVKYGPPRSKLDLVVRADRAASWRAVRRVLAAAEECRLLRIRFLVLARSGIGDIETFLDDPRAGSADVRVRVRPGSTEAFMRPSDEHCERTVSVEADPDTPFERVVETIAAYERTGASVCVR